MFDYNKIYKINRSVWGNEVNPIIIKTLKFLKDRQALKALDLGCGQGKEAFFLAKKGLRVTAIDSSAVAIKQIHEKEKNKKLPIKAICRNASDYKIKDNKYDIIIGMDILQFLKRKKVVNLIKNIKTNLKINGLVILSSFTTQDPLYIQSSKKNIQYYFKPKEIKLYFKNFELLHYSERMVIDPGHASMPYKHRHGIVEIIARKI